jgi:GNAT superfamily N-acetyltransferase
MTVTIHDAGPKDEAAFRRLWGEFQAYYKMTLPPEVTASTWSRLMSDTSPMQLRLAWLQGAAVGFALYQHHPSSWVTGDDCYLEDLYVVADLRGQGIGRALIEDLKAIARSKGWHRIYWLTEQNNAGARRLYDTQAPTDNHIRYRTAL